MSIEFIEPDSRRSMRSALAASRQKAQQRYQQVVQSTERAAEALLPLQQTEGYWCGELTADSTLESDYVLLQLWMYQPDADGSWNPPTRSRLEKACRQILRNQLPDGGWSIYKPGPSELNATVRAYTALKLCGSDINSEEMARRVAGRSTWAVCSPATATPGSTSVSSIFTRAGSCRAFHPKSFWRLETSCTRCRRGRERSS